MHKTTKIFMLFFIVAYVNANFRTLDGTGNNVDHPDWGAVGPYQWFQTSVDYGDGKSSPNGDTRPSAREISNKLGSLQNFQTPTHTNELHTYFAAMISIDVAKTGENSTEPLPIPVPTGDYFKDYHQEGNKTIPFVRAVHIPGTGTSNDNPRKILNLHSSFLDLTWMYGPNKQDMNKARTFQGGKIELGLTDDQTGSFPVS
eukprot:TRINITY_DN3784_c0_g3_i1.p1 TRINITY_DN3784_c0_g3~~TRINITY_DN3784_c0_g3_i1.p1  ORF type:complete len:211 (+),score=47.23 TRINITY_DN3784_c0_g3_i1:32-634(+)